MLIKRTARPSESALRTLWPEAGMRPPSKRTAPLPDPKSDEQKEAEARAKLGVPRVPQTKLASGDGRRKDAPFNGDKRQKYAAPTPREDGTNAFAPFGGAASTIPATWGPGFVATEGREGSQEPVGYRARPVMASLKDPLTGKSLGKVQTGWAGGAERVSTKQGDRIVYPASDKSPCWGSGERVSLSRSTETREGANGSRTVEVWRIKCPGCGHTRDLSARKVEAISPLPTDWEYPHHARPPGATAGRVIAPGAREDFVPWTPTAAHPEDRWGATSAAIGRSTVRSMSVVSAKMFDGTPMRVATTDSRGGVEGYIRGERIFREAVKAGEDLSLRVYLTADEHGKPISVRLPEIDPYARSAPSSTVAPDKGRAVANGRVRDVSLSDLEAARVKRAPAPMILCDARKAPPRTIVAF